MIWKVVIVSISKGEVIFVVNIYRLDSLFICTYYHEKWTEQGPNLNTQLNYDSNIFNTFNNIDKSNQFIVEDFLIP